MSDEGSPRPMDDEPVKAENGVQDDGRSPSRERSASAARDRSRSRSPARQRSRSPEAAEREISPERSPVVRNHVVITLACQRKFLALL